jgi:hypothetical protein
MANYTVLSSLEEIKNEVKELRQIISAQGGHIDRSQQIISQLLGGLLNEKQQKVLQCYLSILMGERYIEDIDTNDETYDDEEEDQRFTTRQGDAHEERLNLLEEKFQERDAQMTLLEEKNRIMEEKIEAMEKRQLEKMGLNKK